MSVLSKKNRDVGAEQHPDSRDHRHHLQDVTNDDFLIEALVQGGNGVCQVDGQPAHARPDREPEHVVSKNPRMAAIVDLLGEVAQTTSTVLIEGETGTGKELLARALHAASRARDGPMVAVNCAALPEQLLESELFGHEKGSFTSAAGRRKGRFELAHGGTLFLDEVGDIPAAMQCKLLRVLQERKLERVGGIQTIAVDVRVIAATNRCLSDLVRAGKFREDLYYRLDVVKIELPPLRERPEDIPMLAVHFAQKYARFGEAPKDIDPRALQRLQAYGWPGNVRQLENAIERACAVTRCNIIRLQDLPADVMNEASPRPRITVDLEKTLPELLREAAGVIEEQFIRTALEKSHGNVGRCAKICGLCRRSLGHKLKQYGIDKSEFKDRDRRRVLDVDPSESENGVA